MPEIPQRVLGRTGRMVTTFGLGGEGVLRTRGLHDEAAQVIERAITLGVNYFDTAPAYASSMDYLGAVIPPHRNRIFLACKTADRTRDGSERVLEDALERLRVGSLDLWQLHDLRSFKELDRIFAKDGAIHALVDAQRAGVVKHLGITGHHDPAVLLEAMRRFDFDTVLMPVNFADVHRLSFVREVLPVAAAKRMGVIAMKVYFGGLLGLSGREMDAEPALRYALSQEDVSTAIIGCRTPEEVEANIQFAKRFEAMAEEEQRQFEDRYTNGDWTPYKRGELVAPEALLR